jgi:hypothetical protein
LLPSGAASSSLPLLLSAAAAVASAGKSLLPPGAVLLLVMGGPLLPCSVTHTSASVPAPARLLVTTVTCVSVEHGVLLSAC